MGLSLKKYCEVSGIVIPFPLFIFRRNVIFLSLLPTCVRVYSKLKRGISYYERNHDIYSFYPREICIKSTNEPLFLICFGTSRKMLSILFLLNIFIIVVSLLFIIVEKNFNDLMKK